MDVSWQRLSIVTAISLIIWAALILGFGFMLERMPTLQHPIQKTIHAQLVELKPPPPIPTPPPAVIKPVEKPKILLKHQTKHILKHDHISQVSVPHSPVAPLPVTDSHSDAPAIIAAADNRNDSADGKAIHGVVADAIGEPSKLPITPPSYGAAYLDNPKPAYPASAKRMSMTGTVLLKVLVSREGTALKIETARSSGHEILDSAAYEAVIKWRFIPARQADAAVEQWVEVPIAFRLN